MNFSDIVFAPAWWMLLTGVLVAGVLLYLANKRLDKLLRNVGVGALLLVAAWAVVGRLVDTPREAARDGTRAFVAAVVARDTAKVSSLLAVDATCGSLDKAGIVSIITPYAERWALQSATITGSELEERGSQIACTSHIVTQHDGSSPGPAIFTTDWRFTWAREGNTWRIQSIEPVRVGTDDVSELVGRYFTKPR